jgi:hypothetical protein
LAHGLDDRVERHEVCAVAVQREAGRQHGNRRRNRIALYAGHLHESAGRVLSVALVDDDGGTVGEDVLS